MSLLINIILGCALLGSALSMSVFLNSDLYVADMLSHFRLQYLVMLLPALLLCWVGRRRIMFLLLLVCFLSHAVTVAYAFRPLNTTSLPENPQRTLRVMSSNLLASNMPSDAYYDFLNNIDPDVVVFLEYTPNWHLSLKSTLTDYPYRVTKVKDTPFGIAIYAKHPIIEESIVHHDSIHSPSIHAVLEMGDAAITVIGTHPIAPVRLPLFQSRNRQLAALSEFTAQVSTPLVLAGDLNVSHWSGQFRKLEKHGKLVDARRGQNLTPTWPSPYWPFMIPIDHILVNEGFNVIDMQAGYAPGSDHWGIWADLQY